MKVNLVDTHRLPYRNAKIRAWDSAKVSRVNFFDADDTDLGDELATNAVGMICNAGGTVGTNGYFVKQKSVIQISLDNGVHWPIEYVVGPQGDGADTVNDGKVFSKTGAEVFSANSPNNYTLNYDDLANAPQIGVWCEKEQFVIVESSDTRPSEGANIVELDKFAGTVIMSNNVFPEGVHIEPRAVAARYGQRVAVMNVGPYPILLMCPMTGNVVLEQNRSEILYSVQEGETMQFERITGAPGRADVRMLDTYDTISTTSTEHDVVYIPSSTSYATVALVGTPNNRQGDRLSITVIPRVDGTSVPKIVNVVSGPSARPECTIDTSKTGASRVDAVFIGNAWVVSDVSSTTEPSSVVTKVLASDVSQIVDGTCNVYVGVNQFTRTIIVDASNLPVADVPCEYIVVHPTYPTGVSFAGKEIMLIVKKPSGLDYDWYATYSTQNLKRRLKAILHPVPVACRFGNVHTYFTHTLEITKEPFSSDDPTEAGYRNSWLICDVVQRYWFPTPDRAYLLSHMAMNVDEVPPEA